MNLAPMETSDLAGCEAALTTLLRLEPTNNRLLLLLGKVQMAQGRSAEAAWTLGRILDRAPDEVPALLALVDCECQQEDYIAARLDCLKVLKLDCNASCRYCLEASEFKVDYGACSPQIMGLARDFVRRGGHLLLTGGEPFLPKWGFGRVLEELIHEPELKDKARLVQHPRHPFDGNLLINGPNQMGRISLHTNGTYLNARNRDLLLRGPVFSVGISMDTLRKDLFEYLRRGTRFDQVWSNATSLLQERAERKQNLPHITILCAVMKCTSAHLRETVDLATHAGIGIGLHALFQSYHSPEFSRNQGLQNLSLTELEALYQTVLEIERDYGPTGPVGYQGFKGQMAHLLKCASEGGGDAQVILGGGGHFFRHDYFGQIEAAEKLAAQREFPEARRLLEPLREKARKSTRFLQVLADTEAGENNLAAAAVCYTQILNLDPRDEKALDFREAHPQLTAANESLLHPTREGTEQS